MRAAFFSLVLSVLSIGAFAQDMPEPKLEPKTGQGMQQGFPQTAIQFKQRHHEPMEPLIACAGKIPGVICSFVAGGHMQNGVCSMPPLREEKAGLVAQSQPLAHCRPSNSEAEHTMENPKIRPPADAHPSDSEPFRATPTAY